METQESNWNIPATSLIATWIRTTDTHAVYGNGYQYSNWSQAVNHMPFFCSASIPATLHRAKLALPWKKLHFIKKVNTSAVWSV